MALAGEVGELMEIFQRMIEVQSQDAGRDPKTSQAVKDELADVQICLTRLASVLGVDLNEAVQQKLQKNAEKYPADKVRGTNKKTRNSELFPWHLHFLRYRGSAANSWRRTVRFLGGADLPSGAAHQWMDGAGRMLVP